MGTPCPIPTGKTIPGTARAHPGGWQRPSKRRRGRRAAKGGLFTLCSSSKQLSGCGEGFPGSWREGWPPCSLSHPGLHLSEGSPGTAWGPRRWQSPQCTRPAPRETAQLISSPLSLPVPSGLAGGSGSNRSEETAGSHVAASHQGLKSCQGCPRLPMPPQLQLDPNSQRAPSSQQSPEPPAARDVDGPCSAV